MRRLQYRNAFLLSVLMLVLAKGASRADDVKESKFDGPYGVVLKLRMEGPYTADVPLQVVCYFKYVPENPKPLSGAPVELDKKLGGLINALRERAEFKGDTFETLLIQPPADTIKAKSLLLIGLGEEKALSLELMQQVGKTALREAVRIGADRVAFAPLLRDQGNATLAAGDVERWVTRGVLMAYRTELQLQREGFAKEYALREWIAEAGPAYFDDTEVGLKAGIHDSQLMLRESPNLPYVSGK